VLPSHVDQALQRVEDRPKEDWRPDLGKILGGTLLGVGITGFIEEVQGGAAKMDVHFLVVYVVLGVVGSVMVSISYRL
jgi:hypothetical protein